MIATARFIYIHLHKSGGTFVNECLLRFFPGARQLGYHLPRNMIPAGLAALPVLGFVRNPWSYYVSWYAFQSSQKNPNPLFQCVSENGSLGFNETVRNLVELGEQPDRLARVLQALPGVHTNRGLNLTAAGLAPILHSEMGFYTYLYRYMFDGDPNSLFMGRTENIPHDLLAILRQLGSPVPQELEYFLEHAARRNTSAHGAYQSYYDTPTRRLVASRDCFLIETYKYRFDD